MNVFGIGNCGAIPGHLIPDYATVVREGFRGLVSRFRELQKTASPAHRDFLEALITTCEAAPRFTSRYTELAEKTAEAERDPDARPSFTRSRDLPEGPLGTGREFPEAVQSLWFTHMLVMAQESYPGPGLSPGRVDQYLYPYYQADLDAGRITREQAREILSAGSSSTTTPTTTWAGWAPTRASTPASASSSPWAACGPDGEDPRNDLTCLMLDVIEDMNLLEPKPNVRFHQEPADRCSTGWWTWSARRRARPSCSTSTRPRCAALPGPDCPRTELWDYAPVGCLENTLQGNDRSGTVDVNLNLAKAVELVFGRRPGPAGWQADRARRPATRALRILRAFQDAYHAQLAPSAGIASSRGQRQADAIRAEFEPTPYLSALVGGCAESGKDVTAGGPRFNFITVEGVAFATAVDSLAAVKKLVFDEQNGAPWTNW